ncbi:MAG TPA: MFS transporter [Candidatus Didemnitutus sp.]|jgi:putative MFS transporter
MNIVARAPTESTARIYWTAFIGLFFDYYDLYLFIYLEKALAARFSLDGNASHWIQFAALAAVGMGSLSFGYLADRWGRGRVMLAVFVVYAIGVTGISLASSVTGLVVARVVASMALGAEWGISHAYLAERIGPERRYRLAALLQFSLLGGLLAALAARFGVPLIGWRFLFALSIVPVAILSAVRWRSLSSSAAPAGPASEPLPPLMRSIADNAGPFAFCLALASLSIASGTMNVFLSKELPQSPWFPVAFWGALVPGMLLGTAGVRRFGVGPTLGAYAIGVMVLAVTVWFSAAADRAAIFSIVLSFLNGIPFGLMGALFNEMFSGYRTMLSGAAYNLGRIVAGFSPVLITTLGLNRDGNYFLFTAALGAAVLAMAVGLTLRRRAPTAAR